jgi:hypothetical protein
MRVRKRTLAALALMLGACQGPAPSYPVTPYKAVPAPQSQVAPPDPSVPGKPCTINGVPCTPEQVAAIAARAEMHRKIRENRQRADAAAEALGRSPGFITVGDARDYVWQQWGGPDRTDFVDTPYGSMEWWFYDDGKAVSLVDDRVHSVHY